MSKFNQTVSDEEYSEFQEFMKEYSKRKQEKRENSLLYRIYNMVKHEDKK